MMEGHPPTVPTTLLTSTRNARPGEELDYWRAAIDLVCPMDFKALGERPFHGEAIWSGFGDLKLADLRVGPLITERSDAIVSRSGSEVLQCNLVMSGTMEGTQNGRQVHLAGGTGAFYDGARPYRTLHRTNLHLMNLQIPHAMIAGGGTAIDCLTSRDLARSSELFPLVMGYVTQLAKRAAHFDAQTASLVGRNLADLVNAMAAEVMRKTPFHLAEHTTAATMRVRAFVEEHLSNPNLDPLMVSEALRLSPRYINKLLEKDGTSLGRLIWHRRLERIAADLRDPMLAQRTISMIALARGFNDLAHFSRAFRRRYDMTPREYRAAAL